MSKHMLEVKKHQHYELSNVPDLLSCICFQQAQVDVLLADQAFYDQIVLIKQLNIVSVVFNLVQDIIPVRKSHHNQLKQRSHMNRSITSATNDQVGEMKNILQKMRINFEARK